MFLRIGISWKGFEHGKNGDGEECHRFDLPFKKCPKIEIGTFMPKCVTPKLSISNIRTVGVRIYMTMTSRLRVRDFFVSTCLFRESLSTERKFKF